MMTTEPHPRPQPASASELLPCPFCGKPASRQIANTGTCWVCCSSCDAEGPLSHDEASAVVKWNARSPKWECMTWVERQLPSPRKVIAESNGHHWIERFNLVCCRDCGFVRRADDQNKPCKGVVKVELRAPARCDVLSESVADELRELRGVVEAVRGDRGVLRVSGTRGDSQDVGVIGIKPFFEIIDRAIAALALPSAMSGCGWPGCEDPNCDYGRGPNTDPLLDSRNPNHGRIGGLREGTSANQGGKQ